MLAQQADQVLEVHQAQQRPASGQGHKGIDRGQIGPSGGQGTDMRGEGIQEKDAGFAPGHPLGQEGKLLPDEGVEGMGYGENKLTIRAIGYSCRFIYKARSRAR